MRNNNKEDKKDKKDKNGENAKTPDEGDKENQPPEAIDDDKAKDAGKTNNKTKNLITSTTNNTANNTTIATNTVNTTATTTTTTTNNIVGDIPPVLHLRFATPRAGDVMCCRCPAILQEADDNEYAYYCEACGHRRCRRCWVRGTRR